MGSRDGEPAAIKVELTSGYKYQQLLHYHGELLVNGSVKYIDDAADIREEIQCIM